MTDDNSAPMLSDVMRIFALNKLRIASSESIAESLTLIASQIEPENYQEEIMQLTILEAARRLGG